MKKSLKFLIVPISVLVLMSFLWAPKSTIPNDTILVQEERNDSIMLAKLWRRTAINMIGDDAAGNTTWSYDEIDSALSYEYVNSVHIDEGRVYYSPDNKLKIYTFFAETCAAHCFSWEESYLVYDEILQHVEINRVDSIHLLDDGKYLILDHTVEWHNIGYVKVCKANVVSFEEDSVVITPVKNNNQNAFQVPDQADFEMDVFMYDKERKSLNYLYPDDDVFLLRGTFEYLDGQFFHLTSYLVSEGKHEAFVDTYFDRLDEYLLLRDYCERISFLENYYYNVKEQRVTDIVFVMAKEIAEKSSIKCTNGGNYLGPEYTDEEFERDIKAWRAYFNCK